MYVIHQVKRKVKGIMYKGFRLLLPGVKRMRKDIGRDTITCKAFSEL